MPPIDDLTATLGLDPFAAGEAVATEAAEADPALWAIIFAGGIGSRFWPLSTPERPKPVLALVSDRTLIEETVGRLSRPSRRSACSSSRAATSRPPSAR